MARKDWLDDEFLEDDAEFEDYYEEMMDRHSRFDEELFGSDLSSSWSRKRSRKEDSESIVFELIEIRESVRNLIKVHGVPQGTRVDLADLSSMGARGLAGFTDLDNWKGPYILLDKTIYDAAAPEDMLDAYCGVGLHEASHLNHTRTMFTRLRSGELKGRRKLWEGLFEDERIEDKVREESPGFSPYLQAAKKILFDSKEFGNVKGKWDELNDLDKVCMLIFSFIRTPNLLTEPMKEWKTLKGECLYRTLRKLFPRVPRTEREVEKYGKRLDDLWNRLRLEMDELIKTGASKVADELEKLESKKDDSDRGLPSGKASGKGGKPPKSSGAGSGHSGTDHAPGSGGGGSDSVPKGTDGSVGDGEEEAGDGEEGADHHDDGDGGSSDSGRKSEDKTVGAPRTGSPDRVPSSGEKTKSRVERIKAIHSRLLKVKSADEADARDAEAFEMLKGVIEGAIARAFGKADPTGERKVDVDEMAKEGGEDALEAPDKIISKAEHDKEVIEARRKKEHRFGLLDLIRMIARTEIVSDSMTGDETLELAKTERERIEFGEEWASPDEHDHRATSRRTVIVHPYGTPEITAKYRSYAKAMRKHVARMKRVFALRLGTHRYTQTELVEGQVHRRRIPLAPTTDRIFARKYQKVDKGLSLCLVLDESGSMGRARDICPADATLSRATTALQVSVLIAEALRGVKGVELEVYSYGSCGDSEKDCLIKYLYGKNNSKLEGIAGYCGSHQNYDHIAIKKCGEMFIENSTNEKRMMIVLSDGAPCGHYYGGPAAIEATAKSVRDLEKKGIFVLNVAITGFAAEQMFKHTVAFTDLPDLVRRMRILVTKVVKQTTEGV